MFLNNLGLLPTLWSFIQGAGGNPSCKNVSEIIDNKTISHNEPQYSDPRFSVEGYFSLLCLMTCISWLAFYFLNNLKSIDSERLNLQLSEVAYNKNQKDLNITKNSESLLVIHNGQGEMNRNMYLTLLILQCYSCCVTNGILPSIQSYSCLPYGNLTYHLAVNLTLISNPLACFLAFYFTFPKNNNLIWSFMGIGSICAVYIFVTAIGSPKPILQDEVIGSVLVIGSWTILFGSFAYARALIAGIFRNSTDGHKSLYWCGVFTQIGSFIGAVIMFGLVNYTTIFKSFNPCS